MGIELDSENNREIKMMAAHFINIFFRMMFS